MREVGGFVEVEPGLWLPKSSVPAPTAEAKKETQRSRTDVATSLAQVGVHVDTSIVSAAEIAEDRARKQQEHEQFLDDREREREQAAQLGARSDCECMLAVGPTGKIDQEFMTLLRGVVAKNTVTGEIDWVRTKIERSKCLDAHAKVVADGLRFKIGG
jgi:hypothetical protein